jgi:hypothetical protein
MSDTPDPTTAAVVTLASIPGQLDILVERGAELTPRAGANADWTPSEILGHLCDSARYWGARMYRVAHEDEPELPFFDENDMVQLAAYRYRPLAPLLRQFHLIAEDNIALLRSLPTEAWDRTGRHATRGRITLREIATVEADHEQNHVRQLRAALGLGGE